MGTETRILHVETEKLEVYLLCKRVRSKVRRKTCRVIRSRIRTTRGKGPGGACCDYTDLLSD